MSDRRRDEQLASLIDQLATTLEKLDSRLDDAPPTDGVLRFTERYAIPTAVAALKANIRALEAVAGAIRISQGREPVREEPSVPGLEAVVDDVEDALQGTPTDPEARRLLSEARTLRDEIRERVESADQSDRATTSAGTTIPVTDAGEEPTVDVEAELEQLREEFDAG
ncbi:hypothetical protein [Halosegnis sp.]|uniref:DUF7547 family protein n=1 Tax=Halosegnis sp. TaxID=2864959 RepID=UPI0035D4EF9D